MSLARLAPLAVLLAGCGEPGECGSECVGEVITAVTLAFAPVAGGTAVHAEFEDLDGDGGAAPAVDPVDLTTGMYTLTVTFLNRAGTLEEDITLEVRDEADDHLVLVLGDAPLAHTYGDTDGNGLPLGLTNTVVASAGTGMLRVVLRHMPPVNDVAVKTADTVMQAKTSGVDSIGGGSDVDVTFRVTVQ